MADAQIPSSDVHVEIHSQSLHVKAEKADLETVLRQLADQSDVRIRLSGRLDDQPRRWDVTSADLESLFVRVLRGYDHILVYGGEGDGEERVLEGVIVLSQKLPGDELVLIEQTYEQTPEHHDQNNRIVSATDPEDQPELLLDSLTPADAFAAAEELLYSVEERNRLLAVQTFARLGTIDAVMVLGQVAFGDSSEQVRTQAVDALRSIGSDRAFVFIDAVEADIGPSSNQPPRE